MQFFFAELNAKKKEARKDGKKNSRERHRQNATSYKAAPICVSAQGGWKGGVVCLAQQCGKRGNITECGGGVRDTWYVITAL